MGRLSEEDRQDVWAQWQDCGKKKKAKDAGPKKSKAAKVDPKQCKIAVFKDGNAGKLGIAFPDDKK